MNERWCAMGNHFMPRSAFDTSGRWIARDCRACAAQRKAPMTGVDIDRIHYKVGAVKKARSAA